MRSGASRRRCGCTTAPSTAASLASRSMGSTPFSASSEQVVEERAVALDRHAPVGLPHDVVAPSVAQLREVELAGTCAADRAGEKIGTAGLDDDPAADALDE